MMIMKFLILHDFNHQVKQFLCVMRHDISRGITAVNRQLINQVALLLYYLIHRKHSYEMDVRSGSG